MFTWHVADASALRCFYQVCLFAWNGLIVYELGWSFGGKLSLIHCTSNVSQSVSQSVSQPVSQSVGAFSNDQLLTALWFTDIL